MLAAARGARLRPRRRHAQGLGRGLREAGRAPRRRRLALGARQRAGVLAGRASRRRRSSRCRTSSASSPSTCSSARRSSSVRAIELVLAALVSAASWSRLPRCTSRGRTTTSSTTSTTWFAFLEPTRITEDTQRGARLRVRASAQHPIALGAALTLVVPIAAYFAGRAATRASRARVGRGGDDPGRRRARDGVADGRADGGRDGRRRARRARARRFAAAGRSPVADRRRRALRCAGRARRALPRLRAARRADPVADGARRRRRLRPARRHRAGPAELGAGAVLRARPRHGQLDRIERAGGDRRPEHRRADHLRRPVPELARLDRLRRARGGDLVRVGRRWPGSAARRAARAAGRAI